MAINSILPTEVLVKILSFDDINIASVEKVCKHWQSIASGHLYPKLLKQISDDSICTTNQNNKAKIKEIMSSISIKILGNHLPDGFFPKPRCSFSYFCKANTLSANLFSLAELTKITYWQEEFLQPETFVTKLSESFTGAPNSMNRILSSTSTMNDKLQATIEIGRKAPWKGHLVLYSHDRSEASICLHCSDENGASIAILENDKFQLIKRFLSSELIADCSH